MCWIWIRPKFGLLYSKFKIDDVNHNTLIRTNLTRWWRNDNNITKLHMTMSLISCIHYQLRSSFRMLSRKIIDIKNKKNTDLGLMLVKFAGTLSEVWKGFEIWNHRYQWSCVPNWSGGRHPTVAWWVSTMHKYMITSENEHSKSSSLCCKPTPCWKSMQVSAFLSLCWELMRMLPFPTNLTHTQSMNKLCKLISVLSYKYNKSIMIYYNYYLFNSLIIWLSSCTCVLLPLHT